MDGYRFAANRLRLAMDRQTVEVRACPEVSKCQ